MTARIIHRLPASEQASTPPLAGASHRGRPHTAAVPAGIPSPPGGSRLPYSGPDRSVAPLIDRARTPNDRRAGANQLLGGRLESARLPGLNSGQGSGRRCPVRTHTQQ